MDDLDIRDIATRTPWFTRIVVRIFGRRINAVASRVLCRAHERGVIDAHQLHVLAKQFDRTQSGVFGLL
ncbi:MAG TPA: hypothetical protein VHZ73_08430 [Vicinamibacterales bacterium]|jgi:hypothetical protein|nr:hypothetical protein [Vicinamibacterales bacterium]